MKMISITAIIILLFAFCLHSTSGKQIIFHFPVIDAFPIQHFQCVRQSTEDIIIFVGFNRNGVVQLYRKTFLNAKAAGLKVQLAITPCRPLSVDQQVNEIIKKFGRDTFQKIWVYPTGFTVDQCNWEASSPESNCAYVQNFISVLKINGFKTGVGALLQFWQVIFGSQLGCPQLSNQLLAWVPSDAQQDGQPSLTPFYKIGGWQKPYMKYFKGDNICEGYYFFNYYE